jgi:hypothetical protein
MKQQQVQKPKPVRPADPPAAAPTVNKKIARLWFREGEE